jgi:hypothetical protein
VRFRAPLQKTKGLKTVVCKYLNENRKLGYHFQYTRNMLQLNNAGNFTETALLNGVAATDWSWSALFADYDQWRARSLWAMEFQTSQ